VPGIQLMIVANNTPYLWGQRSDSDMGQRSTSACRLAQNASTELPQVHKDKRQQHPHSRPPHSHATLPHMMEALIS
jgi:hypothetical protein